jgi:hypothetical protein
MPFDDLRREVLERQCSRERRPDGVEVWSESVGLNKSAMLGPFSLNDRSSKRMRKCDLFKQCLEETKLRPTMRNHGLLL